MSMLVIRKTYWMEQSEQLFKAEYDIPEIPVEEMTPEEIERVKSFYGKFSEPTALYMELGTRVVAALNQHTNYDPPMDAYGVMYDAYMLDAKNNNHKALESLIFTYEDLSSGEEACA